MVRASIITIVRIPYVNRFEGGTDLNFWVAHTMLCSNIETGIGCITSSIPSLRRVIRGAGSSAGNGASGGSTLRYGSKPAESTRDRFRNPTDVGFSLTTVKGRTEDRWERLEDEGKLLNSREGQKDIRADYTFVIETNTAESLSSDRSRS
ncbi:hypothetical protein NLU13_9294 [Sarocladium strictum]|uniref:Uncharacterized protein n=1 Tax=Sarocladium strictum TaxID=5046 RepID=A0AA39GAB6_SARSR|nr:hypothetical protein NLU13_9294 [Sarocladium strictum]